MKTLLVISNLLLFPIFAPSQGFVVDQQSTNLVEGAAALSSINQPMGQSFTPSLLSINFVTLRLFDGDFSQTSGATVYVNLRANSIGGTILSSTAPVFLPDMFFDKTNFLFATPIAITPGTTYFLQPVIQSGDEIGSYLTDRSYTGGIAYEQGTASPFYNLWFQEGVIGTPEPSSSALVLLGGLAGLFLRHKRL